MHQLVGGFAFNPFEKIYSPKWEMFIPYFGGENFQKLFELPPPSHFSCVHSSQSSQSPESTVSQLPDLCNEDVFTGQIMMGDGPRSVGSRVV